AYTAGERVLVGVEVRCSARCRVDLVHPAAIRGARPGQDRVRAGAVEIGGGDVTAAGRTAVGGTHTPAVPLRDGDLLLVRARAAADDDLLLAIPVDVAGGDAQRSRCDQAERVDRAQQRVRVTVERLDLYVIRRLGADDDVVGAVAVDVAHRDLQTG